MIRSSFYFHLCPSKSPQNLRSMRQLCALSRLYASTRCLCSAATAADASTSHAKRRSRRQNDVKGRNVIDMGPSFRDFLRGASALGVPAAAVPLDYGGYLPSSALDAAGRKVYFEVYGCQMNVNDSEVLRAVLNSAGYEETRNFYQADVVLLVTCAIRDSAEIKIWRRLRQLSKIKRRRRSKSRELTIGLLGCMAERLKVKVLEQSKSVDIIAGPDAYRDMPRLIAAVTSNENIAADAAVNVQLSAEETYADIVPVRQDLDGKHAFVSIMRGCDNMCAFCIVPFTRGRERSRPIDSIVDEVRILSEQGVRQVTLLGQNVNSYRDLSSSQHFALPGASGAGGPNSGEVTPRAHGFDTVYRPKVGGRRFADLLHAVADIDPEMRIRFTSPHPKDFPDEVLDAVAAHANVCKQITMPAQSGSDFMLERMRRGYTKEAYLKLVDRIRQRIPGVALVSDFIAGFCGETEQDHQDTLDLIRTVQFDRIFCFAYSMRDKTMAHRRYKDDVPTAVKNRRVMEVHDAYQEGALARNKLLLGTQQLALVQRESKRQPTTKWRGVLDGGQPVLCQWTPLLDERRSLSLAGPVEQRKPVPGDYVRVNVLSCTSHTIHAEPMCFSSIAQFDQSRTIVI